MKNLIDDIVAKMQLDKENKEPLEGEGRFWIIEGENKISGLEERYFLYDCSERDYQFEYEAYKRHMQEEEGVSYQIMVFRNWEQEWETRKKVYDALKKASDRRNLLQYFEKKISFYKDLDEKIILDVEDCGRNYLEYSIDFQLTDVNGEKFLNGRIYNISFNELRKLFNVTGKDLFRKNVRSGLKNNRTGNEIRRKFKEYIRIGAYYEWIQKNPSDSNKDAIKSLFDISEDADIRRPETFWFFHNGITIFYFGKQAIDFSGEQVKLNPKEVSVINGAQTMTNYFEGIKEIGVEFKSDSYSLLEDENEIKRIQDFFDEYMLEVDKKIKVKTIFIDGDEKYVQAITYGLNTQIPIMESDIIADSTEVDEINNYLKRVKLEILKGGEVAGIGSGMLVPEFVKKYLIVKQQPGRSKNLRRSDIDSLIKEARKEFEKNGSELINGFQNLEIVENWWINNKKKRESMYTVPNEKKYIDYGKNYFESFVLIEREEELEEGYLELLLDKFISTFLKLEANPDIKSFKNDVLFEKYLSERASVAEICLIEEAECDGLMEYLNQSNTSPYTVQKNINEYLKVIGKNLAYFRVIARTDGKVREAFPFAVTTFSELYQNEMVEEESINVRKYKKYDESRLKKEIEKQVPLFVIDWQIDSEEDKESRRTALKVRYISDFSFREYEKEAKEVYELTVKAFESGDEETFPKVKDKKGFHIRPKGVNADDTFEFSNGNQITKRTFWANKDTMDTLLSKYLKED